MNKEIQERASFNILRYSNCWEDAEVLLEALNVQKNASCLSIASAGDNSLALLTKNPALVIAIDISPAQLSLLELKKIAIAELDYEKYLGFMGYHSINNHRKQTYQRLEKYLSSESRDFFSNNLNLIHSGIIHQGKFERYFHFFRKYLLPMIHNKKTILSLLKDKNQQERFSYYNKNWNTLSWRLSFRLFFNRFIMGKLGRDSEFFRYVDKFIISQELFKRTEYALTTLPTNDNPYLKYILTGDYGEILPYYIREGNYDIVKENIDKLKLNKTDINNFLTHNDILFDAYNLSDIFEYMDERTFYNISEKIILHSKKSTRIAYWNMLVHRKISDIKSDKIQYLKELSERLFKKDRAFFYKSFYVEEVI